MARPTDHVNLDLEQFHLDVLRDRASGRVLWQPRIGCWYHDKQFAGVPLPDEFQGLDLPGIYRRLGCSARVYAYNRCFVAHEDPAVRIVETPLSGTDTETVVETPVGAQRSIERRSPNAAYAGHVKWPITCEQEMRVALWRAERRSWSWDEHAYEQVRETWGLLGAPTMYMPRTTVQDLYIDTMGVEAGVFALLDYPDLCRAYFEALELSCDCLIDVINASPIEVINFGDNIHSGTLSPDLFEQHVLGVYQRRCERLHEAGKFIHAHWDGDCAPLLPYARETGLDGIEAITPQPQGDVTLQQVQDALGDMWLLDGIPAVYFDLAFSEEALLDCAREVLDRFAPHVVLGISDEISSTGDIERVRRVGELVDEYNADRQGSC